MKNIITVKRINDNARRIYELPEDVTLQPGSIVELQSRFGNLTLGVTLSYSTLLDDNAVAIIRTALGMDATGDFFKVERVFGEPEELQYPEDTEPDAGEDEPEDDETGGGGIRDGATSPSPSGGE